MSLAGNVITMEHNIVAGMSWLGKALIGKRVTLKRGNYAGYQGEISQVSLFNSRITALVYVESKRDGSILNSVSETRRYWPLEDLEGWDS